MALDGINALIAVTGDKLNNANDNALNGAKKQSDLVKEEQKVHAQQSALQDMMRDKDISYTEYFDIGRMLGSDNLDQTGATIDNAAHGWDGLLGNNGADGVWHAKLDSTHADATAGKNSDLMDAIKGRFDKLDQDLQAQDKLGNSEVQSLMSDYNQAETLASSVMKKRDEAGNAIIGKV